MNKTKILELRNQAIENVSNSRQLKDGQIERTWLQDEFDVEFARLIGDVFIEKELKSRVDVSKLFHCSEKWPDYELCSYFGINQYELELLLGIKPSSTSWIKE